MWKCALFNVCMWFCSMNSSNNFTIRKVGIVSWSCQQFNFYVFDLFCEILFHRIFGPPLRLRELHGTLVDIRNWWKAVSRSTGVFFSVVMGGFGESLLFLYVFSFFCRDGHSKCNRYSPFSLGGGAGARYLNSHSTETMAMMFRNLIK